MLPAMRPWATPDPRRILLSRPQNEWILRQLGAERRLADCCKDVLENRLCPRRVLLGLQQADEVVEARRRAGMIGSEGRLVDGQGALVERAGPGEVATVVQQAGEVVEACPRVGMI